MKTRKLIALLLLASPVVYGMKKDEKGSSNNNAVKSEQQDNNLGKKQQTPMPPLYKLKMCIITNNINELINAFAHEAFEDKNIKQKMLQACLDFAGDYSKNECLKVLIALGADAKKSKTALHTAVLADNKHNLKLLLDHGADTESKDANEETPLITLARYKVVVTDDDVKQIQNKVNLAQILLMHGANIEAENDNNETPLQLAAGCKYRECIRLFCLNGAKRKDNKHFKRDCRRFDDLIEEASEDHHKLLEFYGDPKLCGNYKTRNVVITNWLLTTLPIELVKLVLDYDICIFTLETVIPSDEDLALIKDKKNQ